MFKGPGARTGAAVLHCSVTSTSASASIAAAGRARGRPLLIAVRDDGHLCGRSCRSGALPASSSGAAAPHHAHPAAPSRAVLDVATHAVAAATQTAASHITAPAQAAARAAAPLGECGFATDFSQHFAFASSRPIGEGQYGVVYRAQHRASGRMVAVKVVNKDRADRTRDDHLQCIRQEVALWRMVQACRHVVRLEGAYEDDQCVYLVQQLCTGGDLRSVLHSGRLSEQEAAQVMRSVMEVVQACHANHHVYGDCKPANFLLLHPHRTAGCQQFPQPQQQTRTSGTGNTSARQHQQHQQQPAAVSSGGSVDGAAAAVGNNVMPLPRRHTDTIREHLLASFLLPTVPGAASCSGQQLDVPAVVASTPQEQQPQLVGQPQGLELSSASASSASESAAPPTSMPSASSGSFAEGGSTVLVLPLASERCTKLVQGGDASASGGSGGEDDSASAALQMLARAVPLESWAMQQQQVQVQQAVLQGGQRCGVKCHEEMVVLATDFGCCQPLASRGQGGRGGGLNGDGGGGGGLTSGKRLGSPVYMAPEMWQAGALISPGVDVWAAGVMLYQLLSGRYPFWPLSPEQIDEGGLQLYQVVCGIQSNPVCFQGEPWAHVSRQCKDLLRAMLERQPQMRISAEEVLRHPWMAAQLGYSPAPAGTAASSSGGGDASLSAAENGLDVDQ